MTQDVIDATGVEMVPARRHEVLMPLDVREQLGAMDAYQQGLHSILDTSDWQDAGRGEKFVKKSGWRKIAAWFSLSIELVRDNVDRADDGSVLRAAVWARAIAPNGRYADADGYCDVSESRFARNKAKLENDLRGTATTRAVNRAISNLVGMGAVSHEEMVAAGPEPCRRCVTLSVEQGMQLRRAIGYILDGLGDETTIDDLLEAIERKAEGCIPVVAMQAVGLTAAALKRRREEREIPDVPSDVTDDALIEQALRDREEMTQ